MGWSRTVDRPVQQMCALLRVRRFRGVARIEADEHDVEFLARGEGDDLQGRGDPIHDERAQHRALVVHERQHDRLLAEVVSQRYVASALVLEPRVERKLLTQALGKRDVLHLRWHVRGHDAPGESHGTGHSGLLLGTDLCDAECRMQNADNEHRPPN